MSKYNNMIGNKVLLKQFIITEMECVMENLRKNKTICRMIAMILFVALVFPFIPVNSFAGTDTNEKISNLVKLAISERSKYGEAKDDTIRKLEVELDKKGIDTGSYSDTKYIEYNQSVVATYGYGETHKINKTWSYRVDKPSAGDAKPHVHVYKNGKQVGAECVDGTSSHGKTLKKVPKKVKDKVRSSKDYKKGKSDLKKMKKAKAEINKKHLNLKKAKDLIIAAGIFVAIVGVAFFAPEVLPAVLAAI